MTVTLKPEQFHLARHALGLSDRRTRSYRNCYFGEKPAWREMVAMGAADVEEAKRPTRTMPQFWLTYEGAKAALQPGEFLDPEDFPEVAAP